MNDMKLIKINTEHYVVVDDSEIKEGDWYAFKRDNIWYIFNTLPNGNFRKENLGVDVGKITHSTQPLEQTTKEVWENSFKFYDYISLQEVKELIGEVDVDKKAREEHEQALKRGGHEYGSGYYEGLLDGYNQALEDNKEKKYTEEDLKKCVMSILTDLNAHNEIDKPVNFVWIDSFEKHIQSLQPKTEWEVEIVDGKLKLK